MADELKLSLNISFRKGGAVAVTNHSLSVDVTGDAFTHSVQEIGTSEEALIQGTDVGTPGYLMIKNLDATNYVEIGSTTGVYDIKMLAGEICCYRHNSATIYGLANTAACLVEFLLIEA